VRQLLAAGCDHELAAFGEDGLAGVVLELGHKVRRSSCWMYVGEMSWAHDARDHGFGDDYGGDHPRQNRWFDGSVKQLDAEQVDQRRDGHRP